MRRNLTVLLLAVLVGFAASACISSSGDQNTINAAFAEGGAGAVVQLCAGATITVTGTISPTANNQELSTEGYPTDSTRATIIAGNSDTVTVIEGNNAASTGFKIRNIQVNGNRPGLGRAVNGGAVIEIGGQGNNQLVDHVHSFNSRGFSALHIIEGGCTGATITNNDIGPSGSDQDGGWADGISLACTNSLVENNVITDATDGAIVVFGAPGSTITGNTIIQNTQTLLGGINMVDYDPYNGNYAGTVVSNNVINANNAFIKTGIACGPRVWSNSNEWPDTNSGGTVTGNFLEGAHFGTGIAASGVTSWTITGNTFAASTQFGGIPDSCPSPPNVAPQAFVRDPSTSSGTFQSDFVLGNVENLLCNDPGFAQTYTYNNGQLNLNSNARISLNTSYLLMQGDGNLVMYNNEGTAALWASNTAGFDCQSVTCTFNFNSLGVPEIIRSGEVLATFPPDETSSLGNSVLTISDTVPYLLVKDGSGNVVFGTSYDFYSSFQLTTNQYIRQVSGSTTLYLQLTNTANLVVYSGSIGGEELWSTGLNGYTCNSGCSLVFQGDFNLVIYADQGAVWASNAFTARRLHFNNVSPFLEEFDANNNLVWSSA